MTDTLFPPRATQHRAFPQPLITCLVCRRGGRADVGQPLICDRCGADLPGARGFVVNLVLASERRRDETRMELNLALDAAPESAIKQYELYCSLCGTRRATDAETKARANDPAPVFVLIRLWLDYKDAYSEYTNRCKWAKECEAIL